MSSIVQLVSGTLSLPVVPSNMNVHNELTVSPTVGKKSLIFANTLVVMDEGYYLISCFAKSPCMSNGSSILSVNVLYVVDNTNYSYFLEKLPLDSEPINANNATVNINLVNCIYVKKSDRILWKWVNNTGFSTTIQDGVFTVYKVNPLFSVHGTLSSVATNPSATLEYPWTLTPLMGTVTNNTYVVPKKGMYIIALHDFLGNSPNRYAIHIRVNDSKVVRQEMMANLTTKNVYFNWTTLLVLNENDVLSFFFVNSGFWVLTPNVGRFAILNIL